jgi:hypothetical protein
MGDPPFPLTSAGTDEMAEKPNAGAANGGSRPWRTRALATAGLASLSILLSLAMGELAVRLIAPQQLPQVRSDIWEPNDGLGWVARPNVRSTINTGERTVHVFTDSSGFRVGTAGRRDAGTRILLMGDSFMQALQVEYEQSLGGLLETRLPARLGRPVAVRDAGVDGWDPPQYLLRTRELLARDTFALVLVSIYVGNDAVLRRVDHFPPREHAEQHHFRMPRRLSKGEFIDAILYPINDFLELRSELFIFLKDRSQVVLMRLGLTGADYPVEHLKSERLSPRWSVTADICRDIADAAAAHGTPTIFFLVPSSFQVDTADFREFQRGFDLPQDQFDLDQPTTRLYEELTARHLTVLDALPALRAAHAAGAQTNGHTDRHLSPAGHDALEQFLEPRIVATLAAERPGQ